MDEFQKAIADAHGKLVVINFFKTKCDHCLAIAPYFAESAAKNENVVYLGINIGNSETKRALDKYTIKITPTFVFVKDDKEIDRLEGAKKDILIAKIKKNSA